ncbi:ATP-binding cassette domain-containing protein, partial [Staphylococcus epidermidis]|uniref:ATP-binding cassette domain-containing protein n=1 Tax=Staphylococcus epidermidis TaxID=1282 RepID=UPI0037D9F4AC
MYILKNIKVSIKEKGFVVIKGKSGEGKCRLVNILGLLEGGSEGEIIYKNQSIASKSQITKFKKQDIPYIYQNYPLLQNKTLLPNLILPLNISKKHIPKIIQIIQSLPLPKHILKPKLYTSTPPHQQPIPIPTPILKNPTLIFPHQPTPNFHQKNPH